MRYVCTHTGRSEVVKKGRSLLELIFGNHTVTVIRVDHRRLIAGLPYVQVILPDCDSKGDISSTNPNVTTLGKPRNCGQMASQDNDSILRLHHSPHLSAE